MSHYRIRLDIKTFVLKLRCSSCHYDVDMYIIYEQTNRPLKKLNRRLTIMMFVLTL